ncbi:MAG: LysE family transporter [Spirochaetales bacterium]|nr:LysE family transporter [Spirochaetales bacterium]
MENLWIIILSSLTIGFSGAMMPGPMLSATIGESGKRGWQVGPLFIVGHGVLELILLAGLFLGLAPLLTSGTAFLVIALGGGIFMAWMAWGMFRSLPGLTLETEGEAKGGFLPLTGALMSLANPYWIIWWSTIGLGYVLGARERGFSGVAAFFAGHILADLIWYTFVSVGIHRGKKLLPLSLYRGLIALCALFLTGYALYLLASGLRTWAPVS